MIVRDRKPELKRQAEPLYRALLKDQGPLYILGTNETGRDLARALSSAGREPEAFINDYEAIEQFCGRGVIKTAEVPRNAMVISCSTAVAPVTAWRRLKAAGIERVLDYFTLFLLGDGRFPAPKFCGENIVDVELNQSRYRWLQTILADETSKRTLERLIDFRYNFDVSVMGDFEVRLEAQYFEPFIPLGKDEVFVDGGGFDGKTTEKFIEKCPNYRRVDYIEPDPLLLLASRQRLARFERIHYHQLALGDRDAEANFCQTGTGSGAIQPAGNIRVRTRRLDDLLPKPPTFVKLDIEGAEVSALAGSRRIISRDHPRLAVCVYHRQSDFWRVPETVLSLYGEYKVLLRHYTEGVEETVMYFL